MPKPVRVALNPKATEWNRVAEALSGSIEASDIETVDFRWSPIAMLGYDIVIFHWPRDIQGPAHWPALIRGLLRFAAIYAAKWFGGTRFIWVAHNVVPHEKGLFVRPFMRRFVAAMDGVIHFSRFSKAVMLETYGARHGQSEIVSVHGHYRDHMETPVGPWRAIGEHVRLGFVGLIRPYKNIERLADCVSQLDEVRLLVAGRRVDVALAELIERQHADDLRIELDLRVDLLPDADIEAAIDRCDAIILPYRKILNSGAAILALSRNRPVIAPAEGSLPELRELVGQEWVYLYNGELTPGLITEVERWLRETPRGSQIDLTLLDWSRVGDQLRPFLRALIGR